MNNLPGTLLLTLAFILTLTISANGEALALRGMSGGKVILVVSGAFEAGQDLRPILSSFYEWRATSITFNSEGGDISSAMALGRHIRTRGIVTSQSGDLRCASTCLLAFIGGISRYAELGSIEVDRTSFGEAQVNGSISPERRAEVDSYMRSMGVDPSLRELASSYAAAGSGRLLATELSYFGVALSTSLAKITIDAEVVELETAAVRVTPTALTGFVRHPGGSVALTDGPSAGATSLAALANTTRLAITGQEGDWFEVHVVGGGHGYVPARAVKVDQWVEVEADQMFIQIASFSSEEHSVELAKASLLPASVYLASNGRYAVTLNQTVTDKVASTTLSTLIATKVVPQDAFRTYGNTYVMKVCCDTAASTAGDAPVDAQEEALRKAQQEEELRKALEEFNRPIDIGLGN